MAFMTIKATTMNIVAVSYKIVAEEKIFFKSVFKADCEQYIYAKLHRKEMF